MKPASYLLILIILLIILLLILILLFILLVSLLSRASLSITDTELTEHLQTGFLYQPQ